MLGYYLKRMQRLTHACRRTYHSKPLRTVFFGTDDVSVPTLKALHESLSGSGQFSGLVSALSVVAPGDRPMGRGRHASAVPVAQFARANSLRVLEVPYGLKRLDQWDETLLQADGQPAWDVGVVVSFGYFMTRNILSTLQQGAINMHPSLLPRYRGSAPIPHAILNGDTETGISVIEIHPTAFDAGKILLQEQHPISPSHTAASLTSHLACAGADAVMRVLSSLSERREQGVLQDPSLVTKAPKLKPSDGAVCWSDPAFTCRRVLNLVRGLDSTVGAYCGVPTGKAESAGKRMKLVSVSLPGADTHLQLELPATLDAASDLGAPTASGSTFIPSGSLYWLPKKKQLFVRAIDGWVELVTVQPETKRVMSGADLANGLKLTPGLHVRGGQVWLQDAPAPTAASS